MSESRNKREGWYAGKRCDSAWMGDWAVVWEKRNCRTREEYRRLRKPKRIDVSLFTYGGEISNFRFISADFIHCSPIR